MEVVEIPLTRGYVARVCADDLHLLGHQKWQAAKPSATRIYAYRTVHRGGKKYGEFMHRLIAGATTTAVVVDHIDGNGLNNVRDNLRLCRACENARNSRGSRNGTSKYKGVSFSRQSKKWVAQIMKDRKNFNLGLFDSEEEAAAAYNIAAQKLHGEFCLLNSI
jgi:hypothetical protein